MIDIVSLKNDIEFNRFKNLLVCVCKDITSEFIVHQYINIFSKNNKYEICYIDNLNDCLSSSNIFEINESILYFYKTKSLDIDIPKNKNIWIVCREVVNSEYYNDVTVEISKLEDWQIKDYIMSVSKISDDKYVKLSETYKDIYKLDIESKKLSIFDYDVYNSIYDQLIYNENKSVFDLVNSLVKNDKISLISFIESNAEIDPFSLLNSLIKNMKLVIDIQLSKNSSAESLGISGKQFWAIKKYSCNKYSREELLHLYKFLIQIDSKIKSGMLSTNDIVLYIISEFLNFMK